MKRYLLTIEYDGTEYSGWQQQDNAISVQEVLQKAISELIGSPCEVFASGRTDAGVHALGQTAHVDLDTSIPPDKFPYAVNTKLPETVRVIACKLVSDDFHARFSAKRKTYIYKIYVSPHLSPLRRNTHCWVKTPLDVNKMLKAAAYFVGEHDFNAFMAAGSVVQGTVRTIYSCDVQFADDEIIISVCGNGFLYNMVRIIAGTLIYVGCGKLNPSDILSIIESRDRTRAGYTAPAQGLYLKSVEYKKLEK